MKIGQLAKAVGCSIEAIRFYEKQGLLPAPERSLGNFRLYNNEHLQRLSFICYCRTLDISLEEIKLLLNAQHSSQENKKEINQLLDKHIKQVAKKIHELDHLRLQLIQLKRKCDSLSEEDDLMKSLLLHSGRFVKV